MVGLDYALATGIRHNQLRFVRQPVRRQDIYMSPDFGFGRFFEMFEERFGRRPTTLLLGAIGTALFIFAIGFIFSNGVKPLFNFLKDLFGGLISFEVTLENVSSVVVLSSISIVVLAISFLASTYYLTRIIAKNRIPQKHLDKLSELRSRGINELYSRQLTGDEEFQEWKSALKTWEKDLLSHVMNHFPQADYLSVRDLGLIEGRYFDQGLDGNHNKLLAYLSKRLSIIEGLLATYRR